MTLVFVMQIPPWSGAIARLNALLQEFPRWGLAVAIAAVLMLFGWAVAVLVSGSLRRLLRAVHFDMTVTRLVGAPATSRLEPSGLVAWAVHWILIGVALLLSLEVLGVHLASSVGQQLSEVVPRVITSAVLFAVGSLVAMMLGAGVHRFLESASVRAARFHGQIVTVVLTGFAGLLAIGQLGFAAQFVMALGIVATSSAGLALALAFGLGCRELARDFLVEYLRALDDSESRHPR